MSILPFVAFLPLYAYAMCLRRASYLLLLCPVATHPHNEARRQLLLKMCIIPSKYNKSVPTRGSPVIQFDSSAVKALCRKYGVTSLSVFGSVRRGEERPDGDVDLLVSFNRRTSFLVLVALERELSELLGRRVDLLTESSLSPYLRDSILRERQVVYDT